MNYMLDRFFKQSESNVYKGVGLINGPIVFIWTLLSLFAMKRCDSIPYAIVTGGLYYLSLVIISLSIFRDISTYLCFPAEDKKIPVFIGNKLDIFFTYPVLLMAIIGLTGSLLSVSGIFPEAHPRAVAAGDAAWIIPARIALLPLTAYAEELQNLLLVSFIYKYIKLRGKSRLVISILAAAMIFGLLHVSGWGAGVAVHIGIAYIPVFAATLYTGNIWISFLAHFYNDLIVFLKYNYGSLHLFVIAAVAVVPVIWAIRMLLRKKS